VAAAASPSLSPSLLPPPRHLPLAVAIAASLSQRHPRRRYLSLPVISHSPSRLPQVLHPRRPSTVGGLAVALQPRPVGPSSASNATRKERPPHLPPRPPRRTRSGPPGIDATLTTAASQESTGSTHKMHDLSIQKIELFKETEGERKARLDEIVTLEKVKVEEAREHRKMMLDIERERLAMDKQRFLMEAEKKEKEED
ncbi:unnamed protein product, partial [Urochloa humidicola]